MTLLEWLTVVSALHAGFQFTVTVVVYPALSEVSPVDWAAKHRAHSSRIAWLVVPVYGSLLITCLLAALYHRVSIGLMIAVLGAAGSLAITAFLAAPAHRTLSRGQNPDVMRRLLMADQGRCASSLICLLGAVLALSGNNA
jgi:hypothetical protein